MNTEVARNHYNAIGILGGNEPFSERSEMLFDRIRKECETIIFQGAKTLEIGSGNGRYSFWFEKLGAIPTGIDCANEMVQYAREYATSNQSKATFVEGDATKLSFAEQSFDIAFLVGNNIVEFTIDQFDTMCKQVKRVLIPNGAFCISMNDGRLHHNGKSFNEALYDPISGLEKCYNQIPGKGSYEYQSYFWTISMARYVLCKYFSKIDIHQADHVRFWIECR